MLEQVRQVILQGTMLSPGDQVIVAVSGGPDSVALLHILSRLAPDLGITLHVFHLNHGLRGPESDADAEYVLNLSKGLGIPCTAVALSPGELKGQPGSMQANARRRRYRELHALAARLGASKAATGHNRDDQAETVMMRLLRGAGLQGLGGIPAVRSEGDLTLIRPILTIPRGEIEAYCSEHGLSPRFDASNAKSDYMRNRIRLDLLPMLATEYNPSIVENLAQMATVFQDENDFLERLTFEAFKRCLVGTAPSSDEEPRRLMARSDLQQQVVLDGGSLLAEPLVLARRVVRMAARSVLGPEVNLGLVAVARVLEAAARKEGSHALSLPDGLHVTVEYGRCRFVSAKGLGAHADATTAASREGGWPLAVPGRTVIAELDLTATAEVASAETLITGPVERPLAGEVQLDADLLPGPLVIRFRRSGDRIWPTGMEGSKKLQDILVDAKVPRSERDAVPLLVAGNEVLWVIGHRLDRRFLVNDETKRIVRLRLSLGV